MRTKTLKGINGFALIVVVGAIVAVMLIAVVLAAVSRLESNIATNYFYQVQAELLAKGAVDYAIRALKTDAKTNFAYTDVTVSPADINLGFGGYLGKTTITVTDEQRKINLTNAPVTLLQNSGLFTDQQIANIIDYQDSDDVPTVVGSATGVEDNTKTKDAPFETLEEIMAVEDIDETVYNSAVSFITINSFLDTKCNNRSPININTAHYYTLKANLLGLSDGINTISNSDATRLASAIRSDRSSAKGSFRHQWVWDGSKWVNYGWTRFEDLVYATLSSAEKTKVVVDNCNPNKDKSALSVQTTEFCFCSGGYYTIEAASLIEKGSVNVAEEEIKAVVKIYDIWHQTTKEDFRDEDLNKNGVLDAGEDLNGNGQADFPSWTRVNWKDSCEINFDLLKNYIYDSTDSSSVVIPDAIKIGFWDNFEEDYGVAGTDTGDWIANEQTFRINEGGNGVLRTWPASGSFTAGVDYFPSVNLDPNKWLFNEFSMRVRMLDETDNIKSPLRINLPWPAVPQGSYWQNSAPTGTCPGTWVSRDCHERWMNTAHLEFGNGNGYAAVYCSYPQTYDIRNEGPNVDYEIYGQWVQYDDASYPKWTYFAPAPDIKPKATLQQPQLFVYMNDYVWTGHGAVDGTLTSPVASYQADRTFVMRSAGQRKLDIGVYFSTIPHVYFNTGIEPLKNSSYTNRQVRLIGMGSLFDADDVRIIPSSGQYVSIEPYSSLGTIEQGVVSGTITLDDWAAAGSYGDSRTRQQSMITLGWANPGANNSIKYQADFSVYCNTSYATTNENEPFLVDTPVLEDVFVTYFKDIEIVHYKKSN
jgi:type II secretory pathway component PulK